MTPKERQTLANGDIAAWKKVEQARKRLAECRESLKTKTDKPKG